MIHTRAGFVLPVVMVCGLLAISMVVTFQFISSSDYKQVGRLMRSAQATALADLAADEVAAKVNAIKWVPGEQRPAWVTSLLNALDAAKASPTIAVKHPLGNLLADCPVTQAQAAKSGLVKVDAISGVAGPFQVLPAAGIDKPLIYKEDLFADAGRDLTAWDLRGPMSVEIKISGEGGPLAFARPYRRGQTLAVTDTTPPGRDFAVMAYLPPHTADYAVQDLQKGGTYNLNPGTGAPPASGRVMLRGPLVLIPEETPAQPAPADKLHLGGTDPLVSAGQSQSYPDAKYTLSLATVPGPREMQHPANAAAGVGGEIIGGVDNALFDVKTAMDPRRPGGVASSSRLRTKPKKLDLTVDTLLSSPCPRTKDIEVNLPVLDLNLGGVSPVLARDFTNPTGATFDTIDREVVAYYPPMAYFYAPLPKDSQKFKFLPTATSMLADTTYRGIQVSGGTPSIYAGGSLAEGDFVTTEPAIRSGGNPQDNVGVIGLYGVALHESKTYLAVPVLAAAKWLVQKALDRDPKKNDKIFGGGIGGAIGGFTCSANPTYGEIGAANKDYIAEQALGQLGIDPSVTFLVRRYMVDAKLALNAPVSLSASALASRLSAKEGAIAPFGSYFHDLNFWNGAKANAAAKDAIKKGMEQAVAQPADQAAIETVLNQLLPESGGPQVTAVDPSWPENGPPGASSEAKIVRDFLAGEYAGELLKNTPAAGSADPGAALNALTAVASKVRGIAEPRVDLKPRPQGAFGPHAGSGTAPPLADKAELTALFPRGTFPSKARDWESMATRTYETFDEYYAAEQNGGQLELRGAVLIKTANSSQNVVYTGRGIIIVVTGDAAQPAKLGGTITPAGAGSWLTLVHRVKPSLVAGTVPALQLGNRFEGTVLSETGVKPGGTLVLKGSLIAGLLNKGSSADGDTVTVEYAADTTGTAMKDTWTVESSGEVSSVDPGP